MGTYGDRTAASAGRVAVDARRCGHRSRPALETQRGAVVVSTARRSVTGTTSSTARRTDAAAACTATGTDTTPGTTPGTETDSTTEKQSTAHATEGHTETKTETDSTATDPHDETKGHATDAQGDTDTHTEGGGRCADPCGGAEKPKFTRTVWRGRYFGAVDKRGPRGITRNRCGNRGDARQRAPRRCVSVADTRRHRRERDAVG